MYLLLFIFSFIYLLFCKLPNTLFYIYGTFHTLDISASLYIYSVFFCIDSFLSVPVWWCVVGMKGKGWVRVRD